MTRVLLFDTGTLLGAGLTEILMQDGALQVECVGYVDMAGLLRTLEDRQPDVIVLTEESPIDIARLLDLLEVLHTRDKLRVIVTRADDNTIGQYDVRQVTLTEGADLLTLIHKE